MRRLGLVLCVIALAGCGGAGMSVLPRTAPSPEAPVLAPQVRRGRTNEPAFVAFTLDCLAEVRGTVADSLAPVIWSNANRVFRWDDA